MPRRYTALNCEADKVELRHAKQASQRTPPEALTGAVKLWIERLQSHVAGGSEKEAYRYQWALCGAQCPTSNQPDLSLL